MRESRPLLLGFAVSLVFLRGFSLAASEPLGELRVNTYTTSIQNAPSVAEDAAGNFVVVWQSYHPYGALFEVAGQRFTSLGVRLGGEFRVNSTTTETQSLPRVASDSAGNFVVVWQSLVQDGDTFGVFGQRFTSLASPLGAEFRVNTYTTLPQGRPAVASDATGDFVVVWESEGQYGPLYGIFGQRYDSTGSPFGGEFRVKAYSSSEQRYPSVAMDPNGGFVVAWQSPNQDQSFDGVFAQRYDSFGTPLGPEFGVNTYTTFNQRRPSVAAGTWGFVVVWQSDFQDGHLAGIFGRRFDSDGTALGSEFRVNTYTTGLQAYPAVTSDADVNFVVVWQSQQDGSDYGVFGQRFDLSGGPLGSEFRVNSYTSSNQISAAVAMNSNGAFVVTWASDLGIGSTWDVFATCPLLTSVTIGLSGSPAVCATSTGGTATVTDVGGGARTHQWGYRTISGGTITPIPGRTGSAYTIDGADFPLGPLFYFLVCVTTPDCGAPTVSNEIFPITVSPDGSGPAVTAPTSVSTAQTICQ